MAVRRMMGKLADVFFGLVYMAMVIASFPGAVLVCQYFHFPVLLRAAFATEQVSTLISIRQKSSNISLVDPVNT